MSFSLFQILRFIAGDTAILIFSILPSWEISIFILFYRCTLMAHDRFSHRLDCSHTDYKLNIPCLQHIVPCSITPLTCIHYVYTSPHSNLYFFLSLLTSHSSLYYMLMWSITSSHLLPIVAYFPQCFSLSTM